MSKIFFYGLFMDQSLLTEKGLHPEIIGPAVLPELGLAGANPAYAPELSQLVEALQFDSAYVEEIAAFGEAS